MRPAKTPMPITLAANPTDSFERGRGSETSLAVVETDAGPFIPSTRLTRSHIARPSSPMPTLFWLCALSTEITLAW